MSGSEPRPEPLRVPVVDVATRNSLVAPTPPPPAPGHAMQTAVVVQRPVRIVSDHPPAPASPLPPAPAARSSAPPPGSSTPTVKTASVPPPPPVDPQPAFASALEEAIAQAPIDPVPEAALPVEGLSNGVSNEQDHGYASMEVEPLDQLELTDDLPGLDDTVPDEEELDAASIEVSVPPPAPAAAFRRSTPSNDVEITVSYDEEEDEGRPSGEFEELDLEAESLRNSAKDGARTPPPPPPYGRLSSLAEPPDLQTLTRSARVAEARPSKPRAHPWWEVFFDDDYLRTVRPPTHQQIARQCDFIAKRLGLKPGATILDVGCGLGLQAVELASRGYLSVGLDLSLAMLSRASEEAQARGMKINFLHADMRDMNFEGNFDAVMCIGTSLGYFDDETNKRVIERLFRALKPNGVLLLDVVNRDHVIRTQPNLIWFEGDGCVCMEESEFNFFTSRLHVKRTVILESGKQRENEYSLRLYSLHELGQLLHQFGFRVIEVSGREALPGVFFGQESPNMMVVAERRATADATGKYPALVD